MSFGKPQRVPISLGEGVAQTSATSITVVVTRVMFSSEDSGFFIAKGELACDHSEGDRKDARGRPETVTFKGNSDFFVGNQESCKNLRLSGEWGWDSYGKFFAVSSISVPDPTTISALKSYFSSGKLKGIGEKTAEIIIGKWGLDAIRILDNTPERLSELPRIDKAKAAIIGERWRNNRRFFRIVSFLGEHGVSEAQAKSAEEALGSDMLEERIKKDPYMLIDVPGISFKTADAIAAKMGMESDNPARVRAALNHVLSESVRKDGHTMLPFDSWVDSAVQFTAMPLGLVKEYCREAIKKGRVTSHALKDNKGVDRVCVADNKIAKDEQFIAQKIASLQKISGGAMPAATSREALENMRSKIYQSGSSLDESQKSASMMCINSPVSILTGGPGTGKTTTLSNIIKAFEEEGLAVVLAAPTGRASKRMNLATGHIATTMHRALGARPGLGFTKNEENQLSGDVFILDEISMVDTNLMAAWLAAIPGASRFIMVGDTDQLPSVGPGNVIRDLLHSKVVPVARLSTCHRSNKGISNAAASVLNGRPPMGNKDPWVDDYAFVDVRTDEQVIRALSNLVDGFLERGYEEDDIQVLIPQKNGAIGVNQMNEILRWKMNALKPDPNVSASTGFLVGDRVMQLKNNYEKEVFNGDVGVVTDVVDGGYSVIMEGDKTVSYNKKELPQLDFGYATTIHKCQGSEKKVILLVCMPNHLYTIDRSLLYTGITRGKEKSIVVGSPKALRIGAHKIPTNTRLTALAHFLREAKAPKKKRSPRSSR